MSSKLVNSNKVTTFFLIILIQCWFSCFFTCRNEMMTGQKQSTK